ncbi:hypothetical protein G4Y79_24015 [Phototrophicus methaneseepsis]|uniref:Uncharacterized protein n=1 Tax=Phototrophicus methaneseepsis TaxID=2710758 RepID=A0A7S8E968_9CHLR|nr:hypothetical protein [Phototrophicus methaneseepsis]QPC82713.1 hypothetical protein G4Y79_24015 [Phototrophicus methaneseepsis]
MKTCLRMDSTTASFMFTDVEPVYQDAVQGLYYLPTEGGFAKSFPIETPHLEHIYKNFERYAEEIVLQSAHIKPVAWEEALLTFLSLIDGADINWWLVGSGALAVRGIDVAPHDLDIAVDDASSEKLGDLLLDYLIEPLQGGWVWNTFGRAFLSARFEWVGGVHASIDEPEPSDYGPVAARQLEVIHWHDKAISVVPLELQRAVSQRRGLLDRVEKIDQYLAHQQRQA